MRRLLLLSDGTFKVDRRDGEMLTVDELAACAAGTSDLPHAIHDGVRSFGDGGARPNDITLLRVEF